MHRYNALGVADSDGVVGQQLADALHGELVVSAVIVNVVDVEVYRVRECTLLSTCARLRMFVQNTNTYTDPTPSKAILRKRRTHTLLSTSKTDTIPPM